MSTAFISNPCLWKSTQEESTPKLAYVPMLFKRRLSCITKATIEVLHTLFTKVPEAKALKLVFWSTRFEMATQFAINKSLICENEILPATFSLSVFNTAAAQSSIFFNLNSGYTVLATADDNFIDYLNLALSYSKDAKAPVICVAADECTLSQYQASLPQSQNKTAIPENLSSLFPFLSLKGCSYAFCCLVSYNETPGSTPIQLP